MPPLQLFDSSVLIPWLRTRHYEALVTTAFASRRFLLSTVVWMEPYAGTRSRGDKQDLDRMVRALTGVGRVVSPEPEDFYTAGQMVATYTRCYGQIALRDHAQDILIALGAWRACRAGHGQSSGYGTVATAPPARRQTRHDTGSRGVNRCAAD